MGNDDPKSVFNLPFGQHICKHGNEMYEAAYTVDFIYRIVFSLCRRDDYFLVGISGEVGSKIQGYCFLFLLLGSRR